MKGQKLKGDRFLIIDKLGQGASGATFLAKDLHFGVGAGLCVVKRLSLPTESQLIQKTRQLFTSEPESLKKLNHQGIPKLIDYFEEKGRFDKGHFYIVQDFVDGHRLRSEVQSNVKWTEAQVMGFLIEVLEILAYTHSNGVIHRDPKPENIIRRDVNGKLVLTDFGGVRLVKKTGINSEVGITWALGTEGYMPDEQTAGKTRFASDVYAIGCIAIEMLIREYPCPDGFEMDANTGEILWRHRTNVSDRFADVISKMVAHSFTERYANAGEALAALQACPPIAGSVAPPSVPLVNLPPKRKQSPLVNKPIAKVQIANPVNPLSWRVFAKFFLPVMGLVGAAIAGAFLWEWIKPKPPNIVTPPTSTTNPSASPSATPTASTSTSATATPTATASTTSTASNEFSDLTSEDLELIAKLAPNSDLDTYSYDGSTFTPLLGIKAKKDPIASGKRVFYPNTDFGNKVRYIKLTRNTNDFIMVGVSFEGFVKQKVSNPQIK
ncbi:MULTISPECIES: serine/threonine protein kinase [Pseudanabaena]|uniref:non-specific serine/threonine protein kinase n=2 Tax=Pseudanabaena TaxID=1152 RepID=L8N5H6_9CYAN|nr:MULTISPECIES: serine/threonine-protein kinase [Pseudanabaena]ELS33950.1 serine/threonine protein kinase [Pseudanabaena biceps PCC 7429]MDG3493860.1 serine/threonine-protein kinase [Pseudanabaena catenata USMAC16]